jgi:hypothetical protein
LLCYCINIFLACQLRSRHSNCFILLSPFLLEWLYGYYSCLFLCFPTAFHIANILYNTSSLTNLCAFRDFGWQQRYARFCGRVVVLSILSLLLYPFLWAWTVIGTLWFRRAKDCVSYFTISMFMLLIFFYYQWHCLL